MSSPADRCFTIQQCNACGHAVHPARYACPRCHGSDWHPIEARSAVLLQFTRMPGKQADDRYLGTLQTDAGPQVVARLAGTIHDKGRRYALRLEGEALVAAPDS